MSFHIELLINMVRHYMAVFGGCLLFLTALYEVTNVIIGCREVVPGFDYCHIVMETCDIYAHVKPSLRHAWRDPCKPADARS